MIGRGKVDAAAAVSVARVKECPGVDGRSQERGTYHNSYLSTPTAKGSNRSQLSGKLIELK